MRRVDPKNITHESTKDKIVMNIFENVGVSYTVKLDEALEKRRMSQQQLALLTGLRPATISDFVNGNKTALNKIHLMAIMIALRITDITDLIDIEFDESVKQQFESDSKKWIEEGVLPQDLVEMFNRNVKSQFDLKTLK